MVAHAYNPRTLEAEPGGLYKLETRLDYKVSSKSAWVTELNPPYLIKKKYFAATFILLGVACIILYIQLKEQLQFSSFNTYL